MKLENRRMVIAFDPGETTGICVLSYGIDLQDERQEMSPFMLTLECVKWERIEDALARFCPNAIVYERFGLYPGKARALSHDAMIPAEVIGVIKYLAEKQRSTSLLVSQPASLIKRVTFTEAENDALPRSPHIRDACKHALAFALSAQGQELLK